MKKLIVAALAAALFGGCATAPTAIPQNVTMTTDSDPSMRSVDFSYSANISFAKMKMCIAENVSNDAVDLHGTKGMAGLSQALAGKYQSATIVPGGDIFKFSDAALGTIVAAGSVPSEGAVGFEGIVRFHLNVTVSAGHVEMVFTNVEDALKYADGSGSFAHVVPRIGFQSTYNALQLLANNIKSCVR
jgi:hypothetical protein